MAEPIYRDAFSRARISPDIQSLWSIDDGSAPEYLVGPALFDPQVNGFAGVDFQDPALTRDTFEHAANAIRKAGCAHFFPTLITDNPDALETKLANLGRCVGASPLLSAMVPGIHVEGPFLSSAPGYHGAHAPEAMRPPDWAMFGRWQRASGNRIRLITLAPELPGAIAFIRRASASGVAVSLGHTDAPLDTLREAVDAGAWMFTHLGNGCPLQMHRHDNIIQRVLHVPGLWASLIPDGIHLPPFVLANFAAQLGPERLVFTTDAVSAAGAQPGRYRVGTMEIEVGPDRVVMQPGGTGFAGSSLTMAEGLLNAARFGGLDLSASWRAWTRLRARLAPKVDTPLLLRLPCPIAADIPSART